MYGELKQTYKHKEPWFNIGPQCSLEEEYENKTAKTQNYNVKPDDRDKPRMYSPAESCRTETQAEFELWGVHHVESEEHQASILYRSTTPCQSFIFTFPFTPMSNSPTLQLLQQTTSPPTRAEDEEYNSLLTAYVNIEYRKLNWSTGPSQKLNDEQLELLLRKIIDVGPENSSIGLEWAVLVKRRADTLGSALIHEPTLKEWLQKCWETGDFSVIRNAGQQYLESLLQSVF